MYKRKEIDTLDFPNGNTVGPYRKRYVGSCLNYITALSLQFELENKRLFDEMNSLVDEVR